jgi:hypothetical protein
MVQGIYCGDSKYSNLDGTRVYCDDSNFCRGTKNSYCDDSNYSNLDGTRGYCDDSKRANPGWYKGYCDDSNFLFFLKKFMVKKGNFCLKLDRGIAFSKNKKGCIPIRIYKILEILLFFLPENYRKI